MLSLRTQSKTAVARGALVSFFVLLMTESAAAAKRVASDPTLGPAAHAASTATVIMVWSNWLTAVLAVPLGLLCMAYYIAVLYESKLYQRVVTWWRSRHQTVQK